MDSKVCRNVDGLMDVLLNTQSTAEGVDLIKGEPLIGNLAKGMPMKGGMNP